MFNNSGCTINLHLYMAYIQYYVLKDTGLYVGSNYETCHIKVNADEFAL